MLPHFVVAIQGAVYVIFLRNSRFCFIFAPISETDTLPYQQTNSDHQEVYRQTDSETMRAIFALFLVTAVATAQLPESNVIVAEHEPYLRGASTEDNEDRDLQSNRLVLKSTSIAFAVASSSGSKDFCFDYHKKCLEFAAVGGSVIASAGALGNAGATAESDLELWAEAICEAYALAYARACAFTQVKGKATVTTATRGQLKTVEVFVKVEAASSTLAIAKTAAVAEAYAEVETEAFTNVTAYCIKVNYRSPLCGGSATTDLTTLAIANAGAFGTGKSLAKGSAKAGSKAEIKTQGLGLTAVRGVVAAYASSFSFASASTSVAAFAAAFSEVSSESFIFICVKQCNKRRCDPNPQVACAAAYAAGAGFAVALAEACAGAFAAAYAGASANVFLAAEVDVANANRPLFTTQSSNRADATTVCGVSA